MHKYIHIYLYISFIVFLFFWGTLANKGSDEIYDFWNMYGRNWAIVLDALPHSFPSNPLRMTLTSSLQLRTPRLRKTKYVSKITQ